MPELVLLWQIRWRMQRLTWEQTKKDKERMLLYEVMDLLREGLSTGIGIFCTVYGA